MRCSGYVMWRCSQGVWNPVHHHDDIHLLYTWDTRVCPCVPCGYLHALHHIHLMCTCPHAVYAMLYHHGVPVPWWGEVSTTYLLYHTTCGGDDPHNLAMPWLRMALRQEVLRRSKVLSTTLRHTVSTSGCIPPITDVYHGMVLCYNHYMIMA
jgi:hypothetical protein